jgi:hypothetical protein
MELKDFVREALSQIVQGVKEAQGAVASTGGEVSPRFSNRQQDVHQALKLLKTDKGGIIQNVEFDVAVTATEGTGTRGGVGVFVGAFALGSQGQSQSENTSLSRIKFAVPVTLPTPQQE